jgi:alcohol dehydrogenase class IV
MAYELARVPGISGGAGSRSRLGGIAARFGGPVLLVVDPGLGAIGIAAEAAASLASSGVSSSVFDEFSSDPALAAADAGARLARSMGATGVVAIGGGSALDLGKAVAAIAGADAPAEAYALCARDLPARRLGLACVPTTAGTGAELTRTAVLSRADKAKTWLWGDALKADEVVLDPELAVGLPAHLTAATGIDALVHAVEAATNRNASPANNVAAHEAIRLVAANLERAVADGADIGAREAMQRAAALAGIAIDNAGTAIAHNVGHALASLRPVHHGRAVGLAMLATAAWNAREDDGRWAACAAAMGASGEGFARGFERLLSGVGLRVSLAEDCAGISPEDLAAAMRTPDNAPMRASNWRATTDDDLLAIARGVLEQR